MCQTGPHLTLFHTLSLAPAPQAPGESPPAPPFPSSAASVYFYSRNFAGEGSTKARRLRRSPRWGQWPEGTCVCTRATLGPRLSSDTQRSALAAPPFLSPDPPGLRSGKVKVTIPTRKDKGTAAHSPLTRQHNIFFFKKSKRVAMCCMCPGKWVETKWKC